MGLNSLLELSLLAGKDALIVGVASAVTVTRPVTY